MHFPDSFPSSPHSLLSNSESVSDTIYHDCTSSPSLARLASKPATAEFIPPVPMLPPMPSLVSRMTLTQSSTSEQPTIIEQITGVPPPTPEICKRLSLALQPASTEQDSPLESSPLPAPFNTAHDQEAIQQEIKDNEQDIEAALPPDFEKQFQQDWNASLSSPATPTEHPSSFFARVGLFLLCVLNTIHKIIRKTKRESRIAYQVLKVKARSNLASRPKLKRKHIYASTKSDEPMTVPEVVVSAVEGIDIVTVQANVIGEPGSKMEYQICIKSGVDPKATTCDLVFLAPSHTIQLPDLAIALITAGNRVLVPNFGSLTRIKHRTTTEQMVAAIGSVIRDLLIRDSAMMTTFGTVAPNWRRATYHEAFNLSGGSAYNSLPSKRRFSVNSGQPHLSSLRQRSIYLVGTGLGGLVAAQYAAANNLQSHYSLPTATSSLKQFMTATVGQPPRPKSTGLGHRATLSVGISPYPAASGCILISPFLEYSRHSFPMRILPPSRDAIAAMAFVKANAKAIRCPIIILHGTKDCFTSVPTVTSFYNEIGSHDKSLSIYPSIGSIEMIDDNAKSELMDEIQEWIRDRMRPNPFSPPSPSKVRFANVDMSEEDCEYEVLNLRTSKRSDDEIGRPPSITIESLTCSSTFSDELHSLASGTISQMSH